MAKMKKTPQLLFIDLPEADSNSYVSVLFSYGNFSESSKQFGQGHLFEHYISFRIEDSLGYILDSASTGNKSIQFDIKIKKSNVVKHFAKALDVLKKNPIDNNTFLDREKARIKIELDEYYSRPSKYWEQQALETLYRGPDIIVRNRTNQNIAISKTSLSDLRKLRDNLLNHHLVGVCVTAYKLPKYVREELQAIFDKWLPEHAQLLPVPNPVVKIAKLKQRTISHFSIEKGYEYLSLSWPGVLLTDSLARRFSVGYLCSELLKKLEKPLGDIGIYRFDYQYVTNDTYGFVRWWGYIPTGSAKRFEKILYEQLAAILVDKTTLTSGIKKYVIERTKKLKSSWKGNLSKMDWVIDDILDFGKVIPLSAVVNELQKVSAVSVGREASKVFDKKTQHTLVIAAAGSKRSTGNKRQN